MLKFISTKTATESLKITNKVGYGNERFPTRSCHSLHILLKNHLPPHREYDTIQR